MCKKNYRNTNFFKIYNIWTSHLLLSFKLTNMKRRQKETWQLLTEQHHVIRISRFPLHFFGFHWLDINKIITSSHLHFCNFFHPYAISLSGHNNTSPLLLLVNQSLKSFLMRHIYDVILVFKQIKYMYFKENKTDVSCIPKW